VNKRDPETLAEIAEERARARARRIMRAVMRKSVYFGGESRDKVQRVPFPGGLDDPRAYLVDLLAIAVGDTHASAVVDALDVYLETASENRTPAFQWSPPNREVDLVRQRDEALSRAERAEQALKAKTKKRKRATTPQQTA
jgi:hypothetical protein